MEFVKNFFQIKKLIALFTTIIFCVLALRGAISSTEFLSVFSLIIGFYFGASSTRQATNENKEK